MKLNRNTMGNLKVVLASGGQSLIEVKIQRKIFQGKSPLLLLFVRAVVPFNDIGGGEARGGATNAENYGKY